MEDKLRAAGNASNKQASSLAPGAVLADRYLIVRQLGRGGMGAVYEAVDERLETTVALKETFSVSDRLRRQFAQEARLLAQLHHPALPRVSDYFTENDRAFLVMQFIAGVDLAEIISTQPGPFPRHQVIAWADQLLDALIYLHTRDRQIVHRDIKPHNLKLTANGQIALLDFGLAKAESADLSGSTSSVSSFAYTRRYSPLEQIQDQGTTPRSDIYALGATLYHLLTGIKPPDALARAAAMVKSMPDPLKPANEIHRAVGREISTILSRAMAQNPEDRYQSAGEFRQALRRLGRDEARDAHSLSHSVTMSAGHSSASTTVAKRFSVAAVDPFDSYSILKPDDGVWVTPKRSRGPAVLAAVLAIVLVAGFGSSYGFSHWIDSADSFLNSAQTIPVRSVSAIPVANERKLDNSRAKPSGSRNITVVTVETGRGNGNQPGRNKPSSNTNSRSIAPPSAKISATPQNKPRNINATAGTRNRRATALDSR